jgi:hypothetical protein
MRIFAGVFRISTVLAIAVLTTTATRAQRDHDSVDRESCADVKPPVINPAETISNVPIYIIPPGESGRRAVCRATEALTEGMVDFELRDDAVFADALGDRLGAWITPYLPIVQPLGFSTGGPCCVAPTLNHPRAN